MRKWIAKVDLLMLVLILLALRSLFELNIAQSIVFVSFSAFVGYKKWLDNNQKPDIAEEIKQELDKVKNTVSGLAIKSTVKPTPEGKRFF
jgi:hypothetical protein